MAVSSDPVASSIRAFLTERAEPVLGTHIGQHLRTHFPSLNFRAEFPNLRSYLSHLLSGELVYLGKQGLDDVYTIRGLSEGASEQKDVELNPWKIFHNPALSGNLFFDRQRQTCLAITETAQTAPTDTLIPIRRFSADEQREMVAAFARAYLPTEVANTLEPLLASNHKTYWGQFSSAVQKSKMVQKWIAYRREHLRIALEQRLQEAGLTEGEVVAARSQMLTIHTPAFAAEQKLRVPGSLRELAASILPHLSDEEIRSIRVPLGLVWELIQGLKK